LFEHNYVEFDLAFDLVTCSSQDILKNIKDETKFQSFIFQAIKSIYLTLKNDCTIVTILELFNNNRGVFETFINYLRKISVYSKYTNQIIDISFDNVLTVNKYLTDNDFSIVNCSRDGDCFYSSISMILFGYESLNDIKICCFFVIVDHLDSFKKFALNNKYGKTLEVLIVELIRDKVWANEMIIFSAAILLDRPIISFSTKPVNQSFEITGVDNGRLPILIAYIDNHFSPILSKTNLAEKFISRNIQYKNIKDIFPFIKYY